ncbi:MAG: hypothetical protein NVSMB49_04210 [Ktedonobacteraceae bacterium]
MQKSDQVNTEAVVETTKTQQSRRNLLKGAVAGAAGVTGLAVAGSAILSNTGSAHASGGGCVTPIADILTIARTAERLAVTFYTNGLRNADRLGIYGADRQYIRAALIEEQIHEYFFASAGGKFLASTFSFPQGDETFESLSVFIATQQQLEAVFDSAFLAAVKEFALQGRPDLSQIAAQIACIESEHRALGRAIGGLVPADNYAFTPVLVGKVGDAPALVTKAGYLSPKKGNSYNYHPVSTEDEGIVYRKPFAVSCS